MQSFVGSGQERATYLNSFNLKSSPAPPHRQDLSQSSSGNLEVDFVVRNAFAKVNDIEHKYTDFKKFYSNPTSAQPQSFNSAGGHYRQTSPAAHDRRDDSAPSSMLDPHSLLQPQSSLLQSDKSPQVIKQTVSALCAEFCQSLDTAQTQSIQMLSQKQNEIFQMSTKHKMTSAFRNETLGLWYDAKSQLAQCFEDIKDKMYYHQQQAESKLGVSFLQQPESGQKMRPSPSSQQQQLPQSKDQTKLTTELSNFEQFSAKSLRKIESMQDSFDQIDQALIGDKVKLAQMMDELLSFNLSHTNDEQFQSSKTSKRGDRYLSPFQKKLQGQYTSASQLSVLSGSKNHQQHQVQQQHQVLQQRGGSSTKQPIAKSTRIKPSAYEQSKPPSAAAPHPAGQDRPASMQLERFKQMFQQIQSAEKQQSSVKTDFLQIVQSVLQQNCVYAHKLQPLAAKCAIGASSTPNQSQSHKLNELAYNNEQLYGELRLCNDKFLDLRVENTKLREQILKLQKNPTTGNGSTLLSDATSITQQAQSQSQQQEVMKYKKMSADICNLVTKFMHAMRQLQKVVNKKQPDVTEEKATFEAAKNDLQATVHSVHDALNNNMVQEPQALPTSTKTPALKSAPTRSPSRQTIENRKPTVSSSQLQKLPALLQNVKNLQLEKLKLQELILELKQVHSLELEKQTKKLLSCQQSLQRFAAQNSSLTIKQTYKDQFFLEVKQFLVKQPSVLDMITKLEQHYTVKTSAEIGKLPVNLKLDPQIQALQQELVAMVASASIKVESQVEALNLQLVRKEESLSKLKLLFIQKLHELEGSFAEITASVEEQDLHQLQQAQQKRDYQTSHMEQAVESVLVKFEQDDRERDIDQLVQANNDLQTQNQLLKEKILKIQTSAHNGTNQTSTDEAQLEYVIELQEQLDSLRASLEKHQQIKKDQDQSESLLKKEISTLKYDNKRLSFDLKDAKDRFEKVKAEYQAQFHALKMATLSQKQQLDKEQESRQATDGKFNLLKKDMSIAAKAFEELDNQRVSAENELLLARQEIDDLMTAQQSERDDLEKRCEELQDQVLLLQEEIGKDDPDKQLLSEENALLKEQVAQQSSDYLESQEELDSVKAELQQTTEELDQQAQERDGCEQSLKDEIRSLRNTIQRVEGTQDDLEVKSQMVDKHIAALKQSQVISQVDLGSTSIPFVYKLLEASQECYVMEQQARAVQMNEATAMIEALREEMKVVASEGLQSSVKSQEELKSKQLQDDQMLQELQKNLLSYQKLLEVKNGELESITQDCTRFSSEKADIDKQLGLAQHQVEETKTAMALQLASKDNELGLQAQVVKQGQLELELASKQLVEVRSVIEEGEAKRVQLDHEIAQLQIDIDSQQVCHKESLIDFDTKVSVQRESEAALRQQIEVFKKTVQDLLSDLAKVKELAVEESKAASDNHLKQLNQLKDDTDQQSAIEAQKTQRLEIELASAISEVSVSVEGMSQQLSQSRQEANSLKQELASQVVQMKEMTDNSATEMSAFQVQVDKATSQREQDLQQHEQQLAYFSQQHQADLKNKALEHQEAIADLQTQLSVLDESRTSVTSKLTQQISKLTDEIQAQKIGSESLQEKVQTEETARFATDQKSLIQTKLMSCLHNRVREHFQSKLAVFETELQALQDELLLLQEKLSKKTKKTTELRQTLETQRSEKSECEQELVKVTEQITLLKCEYAEATSQLDQLHEQLQTAKTQNETLTTQIQQLEAARKQDSEESSGRVDSLQKLISNLQQIVDQKGSDSNKELASLQGKLADQDLIIAQRDIQHGHVVESYQGEIQTIQTELETVRDQKDQKGLEIVELQGKLAQIEAGLINEVSQLQKSREEAETQHQDELNRFNESVESVKDQLATQEADRQVQVQKLKGEIDQLESQLSEEGKETTGLKEQVKTLEARCEALTRDYAQEVTRVNKEASSLQKRLEEQTTAHGKEVSEMEGDIQALQETLAMKESSDSTEVKHLTDKLKSLQEQLEQKESTKQQIADQLQTQSTQLQAQIKAIEDSKAALEAEHSKELTGLSTVNSDLDAKLTQLSTDNSTLTNTLANLEQANKDQQQIYEADLTQKQVKIQSLEKVSATLAEEHFNEVSTLQEFNKSLEAQIGATETSYTAEVTGLRNQVNQLQESLSDKNSEHSHQTDSQILQLQDKLSQQNTEVADLTQKLDQAENTLLTTVKDFQNKLSDKDAEHLAATTTAEQKSVKDKQIVQGLIETQQKKVILQADQIKASEEETESKTQLVSSLEQELTVLKQSHQDNLTQRNDQAKSMQQSILKMEGDHGEEVTKLQQKISGLQGSLNEKDLEEGKETTGLKEQVKTLEARCEALTRDHAQEVTRVSEEASSLQERLEEQTTAHGKEVSEMEGEIQALQETLAMKESSDSTEVKQLTDKLKSLQEQLERKESTKQQIADQLQTQSTQLQAQIKAIEDSKAALEAEHSKQSEQLISLDIQLTTQVESHTTEIAKLNSEASALQASLEKQIQEYSKQVSQFTASINLLQQKLASKDNEHSEESKTLNQTIQQFKSQIDAQSQNQSDQVKELAKQLDQHQQDQGTKQIELKSLQVKCDDLQAQLAQTETDSINLADRVAEVELKSQDNLLAYETELVSLKANHQQDLLQSQETMANSTSTDLKKLQTSHDQLCKSHRLALGLQSHFLSLLQAKCQSKSEEIENLSIFNETLEENALNAEFRQVQLEGDLNTANDALDIIREEALETKSRIEQLELALQYQESITETVNSKMASVQSELVQVLKELHLKEQENELTSEEGGKPDSRRSSNEELKMLEAQVEQFSEQVEELKADNIRLKNLLEAKPSQESGRNSWGSDGGHHSRGSWGSSGIGTSSEVEEHLRHIRSIMTQFLGKLPTTSKENEDILPILYSMLNFSEAEIKGVSQAREVLNKAQSQAAVKEKAKSGLASFFGGNKNKGGNANNTSK